nr:MAG TPA: hypothetical protein [Caudoviricetes sp.]
MLRLSVTQPYIYIIVHVLYKVNTFYKEIQFFCKIKKAPANAEASTTTTMMSLLWSEGR